MADKPVRGSGPDLADAGDFGGADRRRVEGRGGSGGREQRGTNAPSAMAFMAFSLRLGETIDLYDAAFRDSTLASNILLPPTLLELWRASRHPGYACFPGLEINSRGPVVWVAARTTVPANQDATREPSRTSPIELAPNEGGQR